MIENLMQVGNLCIKTKNFTKLILNEIRTLEFIKKIDIGENNNMDSQSIIACAGLAYYLNH